ncbi:hypothetical protein D9M70_393370 [compost metagenome]
MVIDCISRVFHVDTIVILVTVKPHVHIFDTKITDGRDVFQSNRHVAVFRIEEVSQAPGVHHTPVTVDVDEHVVLNHLNIRTDPGVAWQVKIQIAESDVGKREDMVTRALSRKRHILPQYIY